MDIIKSGIIGLTIGDALGVPVEFSSRQKREHDPVVGMRAYGTHNQPKGTWSDDSSMTFALMDSLKDGVDYFDIMDRFAAWVWEDLYTATGKRFDIGRNVYEALKRYKNQHQNPITCGGNKEHDNGNGSLMRILPAVFYTMQEKYGTIQEKITLIHQISSLTHAHRRSLMGCGIYAQVVWKLIEEKDSDLLKAVQAGITEAFRYYEKEPEFIGTVKLYEKIRDAEELKNRPKKEISGSGYVIDTLEAALWSLLTTSSYRECVLAAVNLGEDTDTVGAVAGSLAGIWYGMEQIPKEWIEEIARKEWIFDLCEKFEKSLNLEGNQK